MEIWQHTQLLKRGLEKTAICWIFSSLLLATPCFAWNPPPVITAQPTNQTVPLYGSVTFSVAVTTTTSLSFQWRKNGSSIPGATSSSYTITNVQTTDQATYFVNVTNAGGSVTSSNATLTILGLPVIMAQPSSQSVVLGGNVSLSVTATSTVPISYQWNFNNTPLSNATNSTLVLTSVQTNQAGSYSVALMTAYGTTTSSNVTLTVLSPPFIMTQPQSLAVTVGQPAAFSVVPSWSARMCFCPSTAIPKAKRISSRSSSSTTSSS